MNGTELVSNVGVIVLKDDPCQNVLPGGRTWDRTKDFSLVRRVLYH
jgi:hypothetical protein